MIVTRNGRPLGRFPDWIFKRENQYCLKLIRVEVSDVGIELVAQPVYRPLIEIIKGSVITVLVRTDLATSILFLAPRKISWQIVKDEDATDNYKD
jgi:hypothetical protein